MQNHWDGPLALKVPCGVPIREMKNDCRKGDLVRRFRTMTLSELQPPRRAVPQRQPFSISCQTEHCCF